MRWARGENAAVLRFRPHDTAIDLVLVGRVSATERANACSRLEAEAGLALALALGVGGVGAVMRRYRGSARLTLVAVRLREEDSEESR